VMVRTIPKMKDRIRRMGGSEILGTGFSAGVLAVHNRGKESPEQGKRIPAALRATPSHSTPLNHSHPSSVSPNRASQPSFPGIRPGAISGALMTARSGSHFSLG